MIRDRMGIKPFYYHPTSDGVLFGSEPKAILANPLARPKVTLDGLRELFTMIKTPGHAIWDGMREVEPGTVVTVDRSGLRRRVYWQLETRPHTDDRDATVAHVRTLLDDIVRRQLVADVPRCTLLSGGLDSSAMTAIAARQLAEHGEKVRSFAVDFVGQNENFVADELRGTPDTPTSTTWPAPPAPTTRTSSSTHRHSPTSTSARRCSAPAISPGLRRHGLLAVPALPRHPRPVHGRPVRRVRRRGLRRLPPVLRRGGPARRHLPLAGPLRPALRRRLRRPAPRPDQGPRHPGVHRGRLPHRRRGHPTPGRGERLRVPHAAHLPPPPLPLRPHPPGPQGPREHGRRPGGPRPVLRPPARRVRLQHPLGPQVLRRPREDPAQGGHRGRPPAVRLRPGQEPLPVHPGPEVRGRPPGPRQGPPRPALHPVFDLVDRERLRQAAHRDTPIVTQAGRRGLERALDLALWMDLYKPEISLA